MANTSLINKLLQNTRYPNGFWGRMILRGMNCGHARLANWGMKHIRWQSDWTILDIGCGGGANIAKMAAHCPQGIIYGIDASNESIAFSQKKNRKHLGKRCFIEKGYAENLPFQKDSFDLVTAFETVYFWNDLTATFQEIARVLKPDGIFLICNEMTDNTDTVWTKRIRDLKIYSIEDLENHLLQAGFTDIQTDSKGKSGCLVARRGDL